MKRSAPLTCRNRARKCTKTCGKRRVPFGAYIHDNYVDDFDYFWLGGDDQVVIVENLRNFLAQDTGSNPAGTNKNDIPVYLGQQINSLQSGDNYFCGGGPGYVLNQLAVKRLIAEVLPTCHVRRSFNSSSCCGCHEVSFLCYLSTCVST